MRGDFSRPARARNVRGMGDRRRARGSSRVADRGISLSSVQRRSWMGRNRVWPGRPFPDPVLVSLLRLGPCRRRGSRPPHRAAASSPCTGCVRPRIGGLGLFHSDACGERERPRLGRAGAPAAAAWALAREAHRLIRVHVGSSAFASCASMRSGKASLTAAARAACLASISPVPTGAVVKRSSLRTAIAIPLVGAWVVSPGTLRRSPGLGVTRRCLCGWNLLARRRAPPCRPGAMHVDLTALRAG